MFSPRRLVNNIKVIIIFLLLFVKLITHPPAAPPGNHRVRCSRPRYRTHPEPLGAALGAKPVRTSAYPCRTRSERLCGAESGGFPTGLENRDLRISVPPPPRQTGLGSLTPRDPGEVERISWVRPALLQPIGLHNELARVSALLCGGMPGWAGIAFRDRAGRGRQPPKRRCWDSRAQVIHRVDEGEFGSFRRTYPPPRCASLAGAAPRERG